MSWVLSENLSTFTRNRGLVVREVAWGAKEPRYNPSSFPPREKIGGQNLRTSQRKIVYCQRTRKEIKITLAVGGSRITKQNGDQKNWLTCFGWWHL